MSPIVPRYGHSTLADLLPSIAAHLGVAGHDDVIGLPSSRRYVVLLVDGLGHRVLTSSLSSAPYFADLIGDAVQLTCGAPSTTATSLTSLGTGLAPGEHGVVGYAFLNPGTNQVMNALMWDDVTVPELFQPLPTIFEQAVDAGVTVTSVLPARFENSGLTRAGLRGAQFSAVINELDTADRLQRIVEATQTQGPCLVYAYERALDHTGHGLGWLSDQWRKTLTWIDSFAERLRTELDDDVVLLITGDHGMIDIPIDQRVIVEHHGHLLDGLTHFGGEGRLRHLYSDNAGDVAARWAKFMGERAWVRTRDEAIDEGWFGQVSEAARPRIGDVLVALRDDWAVMTTTLPGEMGLIGMHGSLTSEEMAIPLLIDHPSSQDFHG